MVSTCAIPKHVQATVYLILVDTRATVLSNPMPKKKMTNMPVGQVQNSNITV